MIQKQGNFYGQKVNTNFVDGGEFIKLSLEEEESLKEGAVLTSRRNGWRITVGEELSSNGGQGIVYKSDSPYVVIKIYRKEFRTRLTERKLNTLIENNPDNKHICWPIDSLYYHDKFVGFLMPFVSGKNLYSLTMNKSRVMSHYPAYNRLKQISLIIEVLEQFELLHDNNVLVGDIKLENIIFDKDDFHVTLIDMDSVQFGQFACNASTPGYDAPEVILCKNNDNYKEKYPDGITYVFNEYYRDFYRSLEQERYALAVLIYRLVMNGGFPHDYVEFGCYSDENNQYEDIELCVERKFAYGLSSNETNSNCKEKALWSHLPSFIKEAFVNTFSGNERYSCQEWKKLFTIYKNLIVDGKIQDEEAESVFPKEEIEYSLLYFNVNNTEEYIDKGFLMTHAVARVIREFKDDSLKKRLLEIAEALKHGRQYVVDRYVFTLIFNIGVLKKVKAEYSMF